MAYKDRNGITEITSRTYINGSKFDVLSISWDTDYGEEDNKYPVFLYTPDMENTSNHYHIELTHSEAEDLRNWLNEYLEDVSRSTR